MKQGADLRAVQPIVILHCSAGNVTQCFVSLAAALADPGNIAQRVVPDRIHRSCSAATNSLHKSVLQMVCVSAQGLGLCHGISGNAYSFLSLYRVTKDDLYRRRAQQFAQMTAEHWKELKDIPDASLSLYEVSHTTILLQPTCQCIALQSVFNVGGLLRMSSLMYAKNHASARS